MPNTKRLDSVAYETHRVGCDRSGSPCCDGKEWLADLQEADAYTDVLGDKLDAAQARAERAEAFLLRMEDAKKRWPRCDSCEEPARFMHTASSINSCEAHGSLAGSLDRSWTNMVAEWAKATADKNATETTLRAERVAREKAEEPVKVVFLYNTVTTRGEPIMGIKDGRLEFVHMEHFCIHPDDEPCNAAPDETKEGEK